MSVHCAHDRRAPLGVWRVRRLNAARSRHVVYVPDNPLAFVLRILRRDSQTSVPCSLRGKKEGFGMRPEQVHSLAVNGHNG